MMGEGAGGASRKKRKKASEGPSRKPRKGAEPGLSISAAEHRRYLRRTRT